MSAAQMFEQVAASRPVVVKNTFINFSSDDEDDFQSDNDVPRRRAVSAPASPRGCDGADVKDLRLPLFTTMKTAGSDDSPESSASTGVDWAERVDWADIESDEESSSWGETRARVALSSKAAAWTPATPVVKIIPGSRSRFQPTRTARRSEFMKSTPLHYMQAACKPVFIMPPPVPTAVAMPEQARVSFAEVVAAGLQALRSSSLVEKAEVQQTADGWSLHCTMSDKKFTQAHLQAITSETGNTMLEAAENSQSVYIVGYEKQPFQPLIGRSGFSATLALVPDEASVCWDFLAGGACRRCSCRWQHPMLQAAVEVTASCCFSS